MSAEEIRKIRELATAFAKEHCMHIVNQLEADSEKDEGKYGGGNFVAALEMFGVLMADRVRAEQREQDALICDGIKSGPHYHPLTNEESLRADAYESGAKRCASAIRHGSQDHE